MTEIKAILTDYLGKDCSGIVADYLRPLPFVKELLGKVSHMDFDLDHLEPGLEYQMTNRCTNTVDDLWVLCCCSEDDRRPKVKRRRLD